MPDNIPTPVLSVMIPQMSCRGCGDVRERGRGWGGKLTLVLRRQPTLGSDIDEEDGFAFEGFEGDGGAGLLDLSMVYSTRAGVSFANGSEIAIGNRRGR